ncbi:MAG: type II toxin-antitoxin system HicB family antitoxin [Gallionellaceae bacterium]
MDILKYKDYEGTAELDMTRGICRGKILFINDLVTYESALPAELQKEFESAVDDYIETCATLGREPQKPLKGQFNVRIPPALHKAATLRASTDNISLNEVVVRALELFINARVDINQNNFFVSYGELQRFDTLAGSESRQVLGSAWSGAPVVNVAPVNNIGTASLGTGGLRAARGH